MGVDLDNVISMAFCMINFGKLVYIILHWSKFGKNLWMRSYPGLYLEEYRDIIISGITFG